MDCHVNDYCNRSAEPCGHVWRGELAPRAAARRKRPARAYRDVVPQGPGGCHISRGASKSYRFRELLQGKKGVALHWLPMKSSLGLFPAGAYPTVLAMKS